MKRTLDLRGPFPAPAPCQQERLARLTRHLKARLEDFAPGGPEVVEANQHTGTVTARLPSCPAAEAAARLEREFGVLAGLEGDCLRFSLSPCVPFEQLDYLWGCLFELL